MITQKDIRPETYSEDNVRVDDELSRKISEFLGRKLELVRVEADDK